MNAKIITSFTASTVIEYHPPLQRPGVQCLSGILTVNSVGSGIPLPNAGLCLSFSCWRPNFVFTLNAMLIRVSSPTCKSALCESHDGNSSKVPGTGSMDATLASVKPRCACEESPSNRNGFMMLNRVAFRASSAFRKPPSDRPGFKS